MSGAPTGARTWGWWPREHPSTTGASSRTRPRNPSCSPLCVSAREAAPTHSAPCAGCPLPVRVSEQLLSPRLAGVELSTPEAHVSVHVHTPDGGQHSAVFGSEVVRDLRVRASLDPFASALVHIELHPGLAQGRQTGTVRAVARQGGGEGAPEDWAFPLTWVVSQGQLEISRGSGAVHVVPGVPASVALTASSDLSVAVALRGAQANSLTVVLDVADGNAAVLPGARGQPLGVIWIDAARGVSPASYAAWAFDEWVRGIGDERWGRRCRGPCSFAVVFVMAAKGMAPTHAVLARTSPLHRRITGVWTRFPRRKRWRRRRSGEPCTPSSCRGVTSTGRRASPCCSSTTCAP